MLAWSATANACDNFLDDDWQLDLALSCFSFIVKISCNVLYYDVIRIRLLLNTVNTLSDICFYFFSLFHSFLVTSELSNYDGKHLPKKGKGPRGIAVTRNCDLNYIRKIDTWLTEERGPRSSNTARMLKRQTSAHPSLTYGRMTTTTTGGDKPRCHPRVSLE